MSILYSKRGKGVIKWVWGGMAVLIMFSLVATLFIGVL